MAFYHRLLEISSLDFKVVDVNITLRSSAAKSSFIWQNRKWSSDGLLGLSSLFWFQGFGFEQMYAALLLIFFIVEKTDPKVNVIF